MAVQPTDSSPGGMKDLSLLASHENDESPLFAEIPMPNERAAAAHCLKCVFLPLSDEDFEKGSGFDLIEKVLCTVLKAVL